MTATATLFDSADAVTEVSPSIRPASARLIVESSRELTLLCCCARRELGARDAATITSLIDDGVDWAQVLRLARWHRMVPLLTKHLKSLPAGSAPPSVVSALVEFATRNAVACLEATGTLLSLLDLFAANGIQAIPHKGVTLAAQLYGDFASRHVGDLDLVVRRTDAMRARTLILAQGYTSRLAVPDAAVPFMLEHRYSETFVRDGVPAVELHWTFTNGDVRFPLDLSDLLAERLACVTIAGRAVATFAPADLMLILAVHGAKHRWNRLEWMAGLAEVMRHGNLDWDRVEASAARLCCRRRLLLGALLAHDMLDAPAPHALLVRARSDARVRGVAQGWRSRLLEMSGQESHVDQTASLPHDIFQLRLNDSVRDGLRLLWYRATVASQPRYWPATAASSARWSLHISRQAPRVALRLLPAAWAYLRQRRGNNTRDPEQVSAALDIPDGRPERPLRVLHIVQKPQRRGAELFALQLGEAVARRGHVVRTVYLYDAPLDNALEPGPDNILLHGRENHPCERAPGLNVRLLRRLLAAIDQFEPDVVQLNGARTVKYGAVAQRCRPGRTWKALYRNIGNPGDWRPSGIRRVLHRRAIAGMDATVALTDEIARSLREKTGGRRPIMVIPNGIDAVAVAAVRSRSAIRQELHTPDEVPAIVVVGSLSSEKRVDLILDAFALCLDHGAVSRLWLVGAGPLRGRLEAQASALGVSAHATFLGARSDVGSLLGAADLYVLASDTEGMPAAVLEAGLHRLPVVATSVGSLPAIVRAGETGLLVPPGRVPELAAAMELLLLDAALRSRMGEAANRWIDSRFRIEQIAEQYLSAYRQVLRGARSSSPRQPRLPELQAR